MSLQIWITSIICKTLNENNTNHSLDDISSSHGIEFKIILRVLYCCLISATYGKQSVCKWQNSKSKD